MKIKSIAAVGAIGLGMGFAGFVGAGTASAEACGRRDSHRYHTDVDHLQRPTSQRAHNVPEGRSARVKHRHSLNGEA